MPVAWEEILVEMGVIDQEVLAKALGEQLAEGGRTLVGEVLVRHGWADYREIRNAAERQMADAAA